LECRCVCSSRAQLPVEVVVVVPVTPGGAVAVVAGSVVVGVVVVAVVSAGVPEPGLGLVSVVGVGTEVVGIPAVACVRRRGYSSPVGVLTSVIGCPRSIVIDSRPPVKPPSTTESFIVFGPTASSWNQRSAALKNWPTDTACFLPSAYTTAMSGLTGA